MNINFKKATTGDIDTIFSWLAEPHIVEFWDNSKEHKDDILNFIHEKPQHYFAGTTDYWLGFINNEAFSFLLTDILQKDGKDLPDIYKKNMSTLGHTIALDFGIGNIKYLGKGLAAPTLQEFVSFYHNDIDPKADTFFIDPDENNPRAYHVYEKAGFEKIGDYDVLKGAFKGNKSYLMIKKI